MRSSFCLLYTSFGDNLSLIQNILLSKNRERFQIVLVNGRNEKMKESVDEYIAQENITNIKNIGFAKNVDVIMSASDMLIGKIGGVAIAEAFNKKLPILAAKRQPWQAVSYTHLDVYKRQTLYSA